MLLACILLAALPQNVQLNIQPDEANAVLAILDKRAEQKDIDQSDRKTLFATEGYARLKKRDLSMKREFEDDAFRAFAMSEALLARREELHRVMREWSRVDVGADAARALAYLPRTAAIKATIYPVIKPRTNSFVFEGNAIFIYVEDGPRENFETIISHELHHIGYDSACPPPDVTAAIEKLPPDRQALANWLTAFGEGFATLAAAGGVDADPQRAAKPDVRAAWAKGIGDFDANFREVERFYLDIVDQHVTGEAIRDRGFTFFGLVGPWYTVGWKMCMVIEKTLGRKALLDAFCDPRTLLGTYNKAAAAWQKRTGAKLPKWDQRLVTALTTPSS
jgi:hypothetical protein